MQGLKELTKSGTVCIRRCRTRLIAARHKVLRSGLMSFSHCLKSERREDDCWKKTQHRVKCSNCSEERQNYSDCYTKSRCYMWSYPYNRNNLNVLHEVKQFRTIAKPEVVATVTGNSNRGHWAKRGDLRDASTHPDMVPIDNIMNTALSPKWASRTFSTQGKKTGGSI